MAAPGSNNQNQKLSRKNRSGYRGVNWHALSGKWRSQIHYDGKQQHLGIFVDPQEAARAYDQAARRIYGPGASVNFPLTKV